MTGTARQTGESQAHFGDKALVLSKVIRFRKENKAEEALSLLQELLVSDPKDPEVNFQLACTYDAMGQESKAVCFYETALQNGLLQTHRRDAFVGLGSTYRCLGEYDKSEIVFKQACLEFPNDPVLQVFKALTLYNLGQAEKSIEILLTQLLDTTADEDVRRYERALRFYADKLDQTWET